MNINNLIKNVSNNKSDPEPEKIIKIKCYKQGNRYKTYIFGIFSFLDEEKLKNFVKLIKKKLCCGGGNIASDKGNKALVFSGNHIESIRKIIIEENIADKCSIF